MPGVLLKMQLCVLPFMMDACCLSMQRVAIFSSFYLTQSANTARHEREHIKNAPSLKTRSAQWSAPDQSRWTLTSTRRSNRWSGGTHHCVLTTHCSTVCKRPSSPPNRVLPNSETVIQTPELVRTKPELVRTKPELVRKKPSSGRQPFET